MSGQLSAVQLCPQRCIAIIIRQRSARYIPQLRNHSSNVLITKLGMHQLMLFNIAYP